MVFIGLLLVGWKSRTALLIGASIGDGEQASECRSFRLEQIRRQNR
jgi:hypothetical protein